MQEACLGYYISLCPSSERELFRCATFRNIGHEVLICYFGLELEPDQDCQLPAFSTSYGTSLYSRWNLCSRN